MSAAPALPPARKGSISLSDKTAWDPWAGRSSEIQEFRKRKEAANFQMGSIKKGDRTEATPEEALNIEAQEEFWGPWFHGAISAEKAEERVFEAMQLLQELKQARRRAQTDLNEAQAELAAMRMESAPVKEVYEKESTLSDLAAKVTEAQTDIDEHLHGDTVERFHLVYKPEGAPKNQQYALCLCSDPTAKLATHQPIFHWVQDKRVVWLSFSSNKQDTKFDAFEMLLDHFRRADAEHPAPIGAYVQRPLDSYTDWCYYAMLLVWCVLVFIGFILSFFAYLSAEWVVEVADETITTGGVQRAGSNATLEVLGIDSPHAAVGITARSPGGYVGMDETGHSAWKACYILFLFAFLFQLVALVLGILLFCFDFDKVLTGARVFNGVGNLLMFVAMLVWPVGLDNELLPCLGGIDTKEYFICDPWELGDAVVVQIVACIVLTIAQLLGTRLLNKSAREAEQEKYDEEKREERSSMWYFHEANKAEAEGAGGGQALDRRDSTRSATSKYTATGSDGGVRADGTRGPAQTDPLVRETSFWGTAFDDLNDGYLNVGGEDEPADAKEDRPGADMSEQEAMMMM